MNSYIDMSKVKTFKIADLVGRNVTIKCFRDSQSTEQLVIAFDLKSNEIFLLSAENLPQASEVK